MHARTLVLSLAPLFATSLAHAQFAGEITPAGPPEAPEAEAEVGVEAGVEVSIGPAPVAAPAPVQVQVMTPAMAPVQVACATPVRARSPVMANRWAVGLSLGSMSLSPESSPDDQTDFAIGELAVRFRATPHLELEASAGGGRERTADDQQGDLAVMTVGLAARWRFRPEARWNWFVMGGIGAAAVTRHDATDDQRKDATQPLGMLGIGVERRFRHFALQAEARAVGMGNRDDHDDMPVVIRDEAKRSVVMPVRTDEARGGGSLTIGASYYF
jgi:hypothetical protein